MDAFTASTNNLISKLNTEIFNPIVKLLFALALIYFLWGVFQFIRGADSDDAREKGKRHMIWGVTGLAIMLAAQGLVTLIGDFVNGL